MNSVPMLDAASALRRSRHAANMRSMRASMTPSQRALDLQRRRDRYRARRDEELLQRSSNFVSIPRSQADTVTSLAATSLAPPSTFASTSAAMQPLPSADIEYAIAVLRSHVDHEVLRMFGQPLRGDLAVTDSMLSINLDNRVALGRSFRNPHVADHSADTHSGGSGESGSPSVEANLPRRSTRVARRSIRRSPLQRSTYNCARNYVDSPTYEPFLLPPPRLCCHCGAKLFPFESSALCCKNGTINLPYQPPPPELMFLYTGTTPIAQHFQKNSRAYNHVFSFTSMGVHLDADLASGTDGVYTYRAQGAIYHRIGPLQPQSGERPRFLQTYIFDTDHEIQNRLAENDSLNPQVLALLKQVLDTNNAFVHALRPLSNRSDINELRLHLKESRCHGNQYTLPSASEIAAVLVGAEDPSDVCDRDIIVETLSGQLLNVPDTAGFYDPLQYPLLHPYGEFGWDLQLHNHFSGSTLSCRAYYSYILQIRPARPGLLLHSRRLLQQFVVDSYVKIATQKLRYIRDHQVKLRAELYSGLRDSVLNGETRASNIGRRLILPASYIGSPRDMHRRYYDAMAVVQKFGKPDLFITMTCNPRWEEILRELKPGETAQDRPDITTRIFHSKCEELKQDLFVRGVLGRVVARVHVIEFQKRGLPHVHILLIFADADKLRTPADYDSVVRAEIPDKDVEPDLFRIVMNFMIHGPCGSFDSNQPCMKAITGCKKFFPKAHAETTSEGNDSYAIYKRPRLGPKIAIRPNVTVDCRWVVPYNPWLLRKFDCHLNVEVCSTIKCVKYLYKYVYKGSDRCSMSIVNDQDEIRQHVDARWISAHEAFWRIFRFPLNKIYPAVYSMQVHLHDMHEVQFPDDQPLEALIRSEATKKTMLTEFFYRNSVDPAARQYLYREYPEHYTWSNRYKCWNGRVSPKKVIGRLHTATPADPERYYLRLLLNHVRGPTSFRSLRTVIINNEPVEFPTFKAAAEKLGLLERDSATRDCLLEAASVQMPSALTQLFGSLLIFCAPIDAISLWDEFKDFMAQKYPNSNPTHAIHSVLADLQSSLEEHNKSLADFGLPALPDNYTRDSRNMKEIIEELNIVTPPADLDLSCKLNSEQRTAFNTIVASVVSPLESADRIFFIDGPGGTGKTFLYRALLAHFRRDGLIALATATSGLAAIMMPGGRTAHSRFKLPVPLCATSTCKINSGSGLAQLLRQASIIIWDEATMGHRHAFEALDRSLQDIMHSDCIFGGKIIVFGGDFRQVLPIVPHGSRTDIIDATLRHSHLWPSVKVIALQQNMRALSDPHFSDFLLRVGDGIEPVYAPDTIMLPDSLTLPWTAASSIDELISDVFPSLTTNAVDPDFMINRALLTTKHVFVDELNEKVLADFPGESFTYFSYDSVEDDPRGLYQIEFLNSMNQGTLPPHELVLKVGCPIMLTRNVEPRIGLCNGTRLLCRHFYPNFIDAEIVSGTFKGSTTFLHRIPLNSTPDMNLPFTFTRKQFPIRLSFALTVHKAQGQTIPTVGVYLPHDVFTHGQLYVALSRGKTTENTRILVKDGTLDGFPGVFTKNIVYPEVLLHV